MRLVNIYPIFCELFLSSGRGNLDKSLLSKHHALEFPDFEYPYTLQGVYSQPLVSVDVEIEGVERARLTYFFDGIFSLETISFLDEAFAGIPDLISQADIEREIIGNWLATPDATFLLSNIYGAYHQGAGRPKDFQLAYAYSHNILSQNLEGLIEKRLQSSKWRIAKSPFVANIISEPAVNLIEPHPDNSDKAIAAVRNLTVLLASMYHIQEICLMMSRRIVEDELLEFGISTRVSGFARRLGLFQQFIHEVRLVDFLSDPFEEALGQSIAGSWGWFKVRDQSLEFCRHLGSQIEKLNDEVERQSSGRFNQILFAFTFVTILDAAANILSFHDLNNTIVPMIRAIYIVGVLLFALAVVKFYLSGKRKR